MIIEGHLACNFHICVTLYFVTVLQAGACRGGVKHSTFLVVEDWKHGAEGL